MDIEQEIQALKERNAKVEADKAWEVSVFRKTLILVGTYALASLMFLALGAHNFYLDALIPTLGFFLSTLSFPVFKKWWVTRHHKK